MTQTIDGVSGSYAQERSATLDANNAIGLLIAAGGNASLAASRASDQFQRRVTEAELLTVVAADPSAQSALAAQIRLFMMLHALDAFKKTHMTYLQALGDLKGKDAAKAYTDLFANLSTLISAPPVQPNASLPTNANSSSGYQDSPYAQLLEVLPEDVADAVRHLIVAPDDPSPDEQEPLEPSNYQHSEPQPKNSGELANPAATFSPHTSTLAPKLTAPRRGA